MSVVAQVILNKNPPSSTQMGDVAVLKLYDRRFAEELRGFFEAEDYGEAEEEEYQLEVFHHPSPNDEGKAKLVAAHADNPTDENEDEPAAKRISRIQQRCLEHHISECMVYDRLKSLQAHHIPRLSCSVRLKPWILPKAPHSIPPSIEKDLYIPGILIEYIDGFSLEDANTIAPAEDWRQIFDKALEAINMLGDQNVLNNGVRPENFIVRQENGVYSALMVDFAQARLRRVDESDQEWKRFGFSFERTERASLRYLVKADEMQFY
ncbi:MAG: hypothetical protein M1816_005363 [Peltula sp. TS41687]|nr:MAG: hypothetical protein M1816_005363 [Peltula sp. TS41687]